MLVLALAQIVSQAIALKLKLLVAGDIKSVADTMGRRPPRPSCRI